PRFTLFPTRRSSDLVGVWVDGMAMQMCVLVTLVSLLVQVYSWSYLADEPPPSLGRYYAYQSLFAFSMLGLVLSPGFLQMFVFWEDRKSTRLNSRHDQ